VHASSGLTACGAELLGQCAEQRRTSTTDLGLVVAGAGVGPVSAALGLGLSATTGAESPYEQGEGNGIPTGIQPQLRALAAAMPFGTGSVGDGLRDQVRALFDSMTPVQATALALANPALVGNLSGVPFAIRQEANRAQVRSALVAQQATLLALQRRHAKNTKVDVLMGWSSWNDDPGGSIKDSRQKIALYQSIIDNHRKIVVFDPCGDGALVELHGEITELTQNVGVLIPGTTTEMSSYEGAAKASRTFIQAEPKKLAMITWMGGDLPDSIWQDAAFVSRSQDLAPKAAAFSHDLRQELAGSAAKGNNPQVTFAGHSYGGAVLGLAEAAGLDADRVLQIESAGMGHGIRAPHDLHDVNPNVHRYSITAEQDAIQLSRGLGFGDDMNHGADPDTFPGVTRLDAGNFENGKLIEGLSSHSDVFAVRSDAWCNMLSVFTGGEAKAYRDPEFAMGPEGEMKQVHYAKPAKRVAVL
jgi:hypothetical protein